MAEFALILTASVTVLFLVSFGVRVTRGVTLAEETPEHMVRLEILNGCQVAGIAAQASQAISRIEMKELEIKVIATGDFDLRKVTQSFIISREKDKQAAQLLATALGLDPSEVTYRPLENNYQQISATLVLGEDFQKLTPIVLANEE